MQRESLVIVQEVKQITKVIYRNVSYSWLGVVGWPDRAKAAGLAGNQCGGSRNPPPRSSQTLTSLRRAVRKIYLFGDAVFQKVRRGYQSDRKSSSPGLENCIRPPMPTVFNLLQKDEVSPTIRAQFKGRSRVHAGCDEPQEAGEKREWQSGSIWTL